MTALVLVTGKVHRAAEAKVSAKGSPYVVATIRVGGGEDVGWWRVTAFSDDARAELERLQPGDAVSCSGPMRADLYARPGAEPKVSLSLIADRVISARQRKREQAAERRDERKAAPRQSVHQPADWRDEVPF